MRHPDATGAHLERWADDPSEYVRRSVGNHLNANGRVLADAEVEASPAVHGARGGAGAG